MEQQKKATDGKQKHEQTATKWPLDNNRLLILVKWDDHLIAYYPIDFSVTNTYTRI